MKIAALISRLQQIQSEHGDVEVVVGRDHREVDEVPADAVGFQESDEESGLADRVVIWAVD